MAYHILLPGLASATATDNLIERADQLRLSDEPAWRELIHLRHSPLGTDRSEVDDPAFFLADSRPINAQAELTATLHLFNKDNSAACRFPARWQWLSKHLDLGVESDCTELNAWKQKLAVQHLTLLFPSMYLQNPASMFGHTFLRFDQRERSPLLAYTLSYAAKPDKQDNILAYVYKGVLGGYPGVFAVQPYYQTVTDYGDIEHRDIWEYSLNLNAEEIDQLLNHAWELRDKKINYYFLRENCAWQLLSLINVARPGLTLTQATFSLYAIPVDTVRSLDDAGVIESSIYRPARASRVAQMYAQLDEPLRPLLVENTDEPGINESPVLNEIDQARVLELIAEIGQLKNENVQDLLSQRSKLASTNVWSPFVAEDPRNSHDSARWGVAAGKYENKNYAEFEIRPALHDRLDNEAGYMEGAALEVLTLRLRYYPDEDQTQLQQLTIFGMRSYSPVQPWKIPLSSDIYLGMQRIRDEKVFYIEGGLGLSAKFSMLHCFALTNMAIESMPQREQSEAAYLGVHAGVRSKFLAGRLLLDGKWQNSYAGYEETRQLFNAGYQFDITHRYALRIDYMLRRDDALNERDLQFGLVGYF